MPPQIENFQLGQLPDSLLEDAAGQVANYSTAFASNGEHRGSGTFARLQGRAGILTAEHVWQDVQRRSTTVNLVMASGPHRFEIPVSVLQPLVSLQPDEAQWGPDVQFLELPASLVGTIEARKSFAELSYQADVKLRKAMDEHGFFALAGFPAEFTVESESLTGKERVKDIMIRGGFSTVLGKAFERGAYDYLETTAGKDVPGLPQSYGGVSGAGLWRIALSKRPGAPVAEAKIRDFILAGVAFYQFAARGEPMTLRYHGPKTLYTVLNGLVSARQRS